MLASRDRLTRWRLVLGSAAQESLEPSGLDDDVEAGPDLDEDDQQRDAALEKLYDADRTGGLARSSPQVARWLGDVRTYFPSSVVQVMQADAMDRLGLHQLLLEPETMEAVQPDIGMVTTLLSLNQVIPEASREAARSVVRAVTEQLEERLRAKVVQAVTGALQRSARTRRPRRPGDIDWGRTVAANLRHYQPSHRTVVPERLVGYARRTPRVERDVIVCLDQSASMGESVVFGSVFGAVMASIGSLTTRLVAFDTSVVDLTDELDDPVEVLFGVQLGGGTDIGRALTYCEGLVERPEDTVLVLISDLMEGGTPGVLTSRVKALVESGVTVVALLALSDAGAPAYDPAMAALLAAAGVPTFSCAPDAFPDLMAAAVERRDVAQWASSRGFAVAQPETETST
ncbi:VWA domain-containing protein [Nocardioidaceae bacterium]|nr:VWA domain-containing protein [Nocardioidaceae bacterium]